MADKVMTPEFRVSYPNVFKPKKNELSGKDEFSMVAVFPPGADLSALKKAATDALIERWGADQAKWPANLRSPFRKCEEAAKDGVQPDGYPIGGTYINLKSNDKPGVVDQNVQDIIEPREFYAGCYARTKVNAFAYPKAGGKDFGNRGVSFWFENVQKVRDGEPFGGSAARPTDDFAPIEGGTAKASGAASVFD